MTEPARSIRSHPTSSWAASQIGPASEAEYSAALDQLFSNLPLPLRAKTQQTLLSAADRGEISFAGLLVARQQGQLRGAAWARVGSGRTASVWPPRVVCGESVETTHRLLDAMDDLLERHKIRVAQALVQPQDTEGASHLQAAGYHASTDLIYLVFLRSQISTQPPESPLEFQPFSPDQRRRLEDVVERTYVGTCDFRELSGICRASDMLLAYREIGVFRPDRWFFVREAGLDVGCLLLADHPEDDQCELLYMGVVPEARGRSLGVDITRRALWGTVEAGRQQLVLGVDAANRPALRVYTRLGFTEWDRRRVFLKFITR